MIPPFLQSSRISMAAAKQGLEENKEVMRALRIHVICAEQWKAKKFQSQLSWLRLYSNVQHKYRYETENKMI